MTFSITGSDDFGAGVGVAHLRRPPLLVCSTAIERGVPTTKCAASTKTKIYEIVKDDLGFITYNKINLL